jgi:hypothetical protein
MPERRCRSSIPNGAGDEIIGMPSFVHIKTKTPQEGVAGKIVPRRAEKSFLLDGRGRNADC